MQKSFLILLFLFPFAVFAQTQKSFTDCIEYAIANSPKVKKASLDIIEARHKVNEVRSTGLPQINAFGTFDDFMDIPTQLMPGDILTKPIVDMNYYLYGLQPKQPLPESEDMPVKFGKQYNATGGVEFSQLIYSQAYRTGLQAAESSKELYKLKSELSEEEVIFEVGASYYKVLISMQQKKTLDANIERLEKLYDITKLHREAGLARGTEANRLKVSISTLKTKRQGLENQISEQTNILKFLMGYPVNNELILDTTQINKNQTYETETQTAFEVQHRTAYQLLDKTYQLNILEMKSFQAGYFPTLAAYGRISWQAQRDEFNFFDTEKDWYQMSVIGLKMTIPVFDGLEKRSKVKQSLMRQQKVKIEMQQTEDYMTVEYRNAVNLYNTSIEMLEAQKANMELAEDVYNQTTLQFKEGVTPITDLLNDETALREAQNTYYSQVLQLKLAELNMLKAKGELKSLINE